MNLMIAGHRAAATNQPWGVLRAAEFCEAHGSRVDLGLSFFSTIQL